MVKHTQTIRRQIKQFVGNLPTNCFSVFDYFVKLALKGLKIHAIVVPLQTAVPHLTKFLTKSHRALYKKKKRNRKTSIKRKEMKRKVKNTSLKKLMKLLKKERVI